jgi:hypothetical protein
VGILGIEVRIRVPCVQDKVIDVLVLLRLKDLAIRFRLAIIAIALRDFFCSS